MINSQVRSGMKTLCALAHMDKGGNEPDGGEQ